MDAHYLLGLEENLRGFDLVHSAETYYHYTKQALNAKEKGYVKKVVATILENIPFNNEGIWGRKSLKEYARENLDHMIALTQRTRDALILEGADSKKITVISHGIDTKRFTPKNNFLREQGKNRKDFIILFTGRLEEYKGVFDILHAVKLLIIDKDLKGYRLRFNFVGEGSQKENMMLLAGKLGIRKSLSFQSASYDRMPDVYRKADLFWAPSKPTPTYQEQYCTALLEAQSAGLPIVTTFSGGIPENVGNAALIAGPGDFYSLKEGMKSYLLNPLKRVEHAKKARTRAQEVHDVKIIAKKMTELYEKILHE